MFIHVHSVQCLLSAQSLWSWGSVSSELYVLEGTDLKTCCKNKRPSLCSRADVASGVSIMYGEGGQCHGKAGSWLQVRKCSIMVRFA